jgi:hypothetical protein
MGASLMVIRRNFNHILRQNMIAEEREELSSRSHCAYREIPLEAEI